MRKISLIQIVLLSFLTLFAFSGCTRCDNTFENCSAASKCPFKNPNILIKNKNSNFKDTTYQNYRGERKVVSDETFQIIGLNIVNDDEENVVFEIKFNQSINPLSITNKSILINKVELDESVYIRYNKKADTISFQIPYEDFSNRINSNSETVTVEISNIQSFDGKSVTDKISGYFSLK